MGDIQDLPSRIKKLNSDDLKQLQEIYEHGFNVGSTFWTDIEKALSEKNPTMELHKCTCGALVLSKLSYIKKAIKKFDKTHSEECWHKQGVVDSIDELNRSVKRRVQKISVSLKEKKNQDAFMMGYGILPLDSFMNFDYSLWKLQLALEMEDYYRAPKQMKRYDYDFQYLSFFINYLKGLRKKIRGNTKN